MVMWGGLATTVVMVVLVGILAKLQSRREGRAEKRSTVDCARLVAEAIALDEAAAMALEAAQSAATTHEQIIMDLAACEADKEAAWVAHSQAAAAHAEAAAQLDVPMEQAVSDEMQRDISMAARAAYKRGDITVEELRAVWQTVEGWDQEREEREQELLRLRAEEKEAWRRYHVATHAERSARRAVELAEVAARALIEEATDAARRAEVAKIMAADCAGKTRERRSAAR